MAKVQEIIVQMRQNPKGIRFQDLCKVCDSDFGQARQTGSSHRIYKTPWQGDPRVNIQNDKGTAKAYQVKQVLKALERLEAERNVEE
ncbi:MAG: toxin HicA [Chloroflexi bacterium]|nr:toxin HicA [Chloroflexota bacterium]